MGDPNITIESLHTEASAKHLQDVSESLVQSVAFMPEMADRRGFRSYWRKSAPRQAEIAVAYILEAFDELGLDVRGMKVGEVIGDIDALPRHSKVMERYFHLLQKYGVIERSQGQWVRTPNRVLDTSSDDLVENFTRDFPQHASETKMISITGPSLAAILNGMEDPMELLFGNAESSEAVGDCYSNGAMFATSIDLVADVVRRSIAGGNKDVVRIIEIGAGFGATTKPLIAAISGLGPKIEFTYTDIANTLVSRAHAMFDLPSSVQMDFKVLDIEQSPSTDLQGQYDLVIATNCIHATRNKTESILNMKTLLNSHGTIMLSEMTEIFDWVEVVWGLLDSWWLSDDSLYALQPAETWMERFRKVGLHATYSQAQSRDLNSQRLLVASNQPLSVTPKTESRLSTVVYKKVDNVEVQADILLPEHPTKTPIAIALVVNGDGGTTVSRKAIRPAQTAFLLANDVLPVILDVRLGLEANLIDGALVDIRDAYAWAQNELPQLMQAHSITLDKSRITVIGYSIGGQLALSTAWTLQDASLSPPKAILSFYGPTDLEPISPIAQVKNGRYHTPTYIVHGTDDEVVPYNSAVKFVQALRDHSVDCGFLTVDGAKHNYDVDLKPATVSWEAQIAPAYEFLFRKLLD